MRGEVGLLSRNILFESEDAAGSDTYGGNLKVVSLYLYAQCRLIAWTRRAVALGSMSRMAP